MYKCDWCGNDCDGSVQAIREFKLTFITDGKLEEGGPHVENLAFCTRQHRVEYLFGF